MPNILRFLRTAFAHASLYGDSNRPLNRAGRRNKNLDRVTSR
jgi:hypothetical protein